MYFLCVPFPNVFLGVAILTGFENKDDYPNQPAKGVGKENIHNDFALLDTGGLGDDQVYDQHHHWEY